MDKKLSIILPVFNEKDSLSIMVRLLKSSIKFENEILIIYDNLNDNCIEEAKKLEKELPNVRALHNEVNKMLGKDVWSLEKANKYYNNFNIKLEETKKWSKICNRQGYLRI